MVSKTKLYQKLDTLEIELREQIIPHLENAAKGQNELVFCVSQFNPFKELKHRTDKKTEELVELGAQILALKTKLQEPSEGSIAEKICWYCRKWASAKSPSQSDAVSLAKAFLDEICSRH